IGTKISLGLSCPKRERSASRKCLLGMVNSMSSTSGTFRRTVSPMAYKVCCTDLLACLANTLSNISRILERNERNGTPGDEYFHRARTEVPNKRSLASGRVVHESLMNPANSEPAVFRMARFSNPERIDGAPLRVAATSAVWHSALASMNAVGCGPAPVRRCSQAFSDILTRAAETWGLRSRKKT